MASIRRTLPTERVRLGGPALAAALVGLAAAARWWRADLPAGADTAVHLLRAVQLDWAVRQGYLYPRWAPDLVFGFGYPLFSVAGLGAQAVIVALHALGASFLAATLLTFALADVAGALGAYRLARALWQSEVGGLLAAAGYALAPYLLGTLARGSASEAVALGLLPWVLWALLRLGQMAGVGRLSGAEAGRLALAAGLYALLPLVHNPTTVLASGLAAAGMVGAALAGWRRPTVRRALALPAAALGLGLLLSAFYWVPVVAESGAIQFDRGYSANVLNFRFNFLEWRELLAWPRPFDPRVIGVSAPRSLGWPQLLLGALGLATWRRRTPAHRLWLLGLAAGTAGLALLNLPVAVWAWERVPGLGLLQFSARLLGPASLLLAVLGGAVGVWLEAPRRGWLAGAAVGAMLLYGLPWTFHGGDASLPANPTLADLHAWEQRTGTIGTTTAGEYLPRWVQTVPPPEALAAAYAEGAPPRRLEPASLPASAAVLAQTPGIIRETVTVETPTAFEAVFNVFYYPGWQAQVDGQPAPVAVTAPHGLVSVGVPAGTHTVEVYFGSTPARVLGGGLSALGLAGLIGLAWLSRRWVRQPALPTLAGARTAALACVLAVAVGAAYRLGVAAHGPTPFAHSRFDGAAVAGVDVQLDLDFGGRLALLGYDLPRPSVPSGGEADVTLYWRALQPLAEDYSVSLVLLDSEGRRYAQSDALHPAGYPTSRWLLDAYGQDAHRLALPPGTPPGAYQLAAHLYRYPDLAAVTPSLPLGPVTVTRPARPPVFLLAGPPLATFGAVELLSAQLGGTEVGPGSELPLTLYWRSTAAVEHDYEMRLALVWVGDTWQAEAVLPPVRADYPTSQWTAGDLLLAQRAWRLPADVPGGDYAVTLALVGGDTALGPPVTLGRVRVTAPERVWEPPALANAEGAHFGEVAELASWALEGNALTLAWRALGTADRSYSVFVHVRGADGAIFSQRDGPPVGGARPTTSWLAGEYVLDTYTLDLPAGAFSLAVGLYDPATGARVALAGGEDLVVLGP